MLTPQDIENKVFSSAFMGYSREEVNLFLEELVNDYRSLSEENATLLKKLGVLVEKIDEYRKDERYLREAIVNAQKISEVSTIHAEQKARELAERAEKEAADILKKARDEGESAISEAGFVAESIVKEAREKADKLSAYSEESIARAKERFDALQREVDKFRSDLFNKYREHIEFIKDLPVFEEPEKPGQADGKKPKPETDNADNIKPSLGDIEPLPRNEPKDKDTPEQLGFIGGTEKPASETESTGGIYAAQPDAKSGAEPDTESGAEPALESDAEPAAETRAKTLAPREQQRPKTRFENIKFGIDYNISAE